MIKISSKVSPNGLVYFKTQPRLALIFTQNIHIYNSETGDLIKILFHHKNALKLLHEDGNNLLALDKKGVLTIWNSENLNLISEKQFPREVSNACITSNSESLYYFNVKESCTFKVPLYGLSPMWDYSEEIFPKPKASEAIVYKLMMSPSNRFVLEYGDHDIYVYNTENQALINTIKHEAKITALEIHPQNESIIVGDVNGRIHFFYGAFTPNNKIVSSTMHWHSHSVRALCMSTDGTQLLSGGEEGVIVFWHLNVNKKTFCPRLGNTINCLKIDPTKTTVAALLSSNVVKLVKINNFEDIGQIGSLTNPSEFTRDKAFLDDVWSKGVKVQPKTNFLCMQGVPGTIQTFDIWNFQRVKDIQVIDRNFVSRTNDEYPSPVVVSLYSFSDDGKHLATVEQRYSTKDNFFLCTLKFWTEDGINNYQINTLVEHPHGLLRVKDLIFFQLNNNTAVFATVGEDNIVKLWAKREKKETNNATTSTGQAAGYVWGPIGEISYKKLNIGKVKYADKLGSDNNEMLLFNVENNLIFWDVKAYKSSYVLNIGEEKIQDFEVCKDKITISTGEKLFIFDLNSWQITHQIPLLNISKLLFNETRNFLYILSRHESKTVIFILDTTKCTIVKAIIFRDQIRSIAIIKPRNETQARAVLICEDFGLYVLDEDIQDNMADIFDKSSLQNLKRKEVVERNENQGKREKLITRDAEVLSTNMLGFFPQKTHLLPPISLIYKPLIEKFLTKAGQVVEEEVKQSDMLIESAADETITQATDDNESKENFDAFLKQFSGSIHQLYNAKSSE